MKLTEKQVKKIEELGWNLSVETYHSKYECEKFYQLQKYTRAGEDFFFSIDYDDPINSLDEYITWGFDVQEHVLEVKDMKGAPDLQTLIEDAKEIEEDLQELLRELSRL